MNDKILEKLYNTHNVELSLLNCDLREAIETTQFTICLTVRRRDGCLHECENCLFRKENIGAFINYLKSEKEQ